MPSAPVSSIPGFNDRTKWFACIGAGLLLYIWWAVPGLTDAVDIPAFHLLNGFVGVSPGLDQIWAWTNMRYFDAITLVVFAALALRWVSCDGRNFARRRGAELFAALLALLVVRSGYDEMLDIADYARASPSIVVKDARIITDYVKESKTKTKYRSRFSFPGDHALVSTWVLVHMGLRARRGYAAAALALTVTSGLPRLVVGGHWITDNTVGGLGTSLLAQGLLSWMGVLPWLSGRSERVCCSIERMLGIKWMGDPPETVLPEGVR